MLRLEPRAGPASPGKARQGKVDGQLVALPTTREPSGDLLRQLDDDPLRAADVAEPIDVFVALHLANELPAVGSQASDDGVDVVDCEREMAKARGVRRRVPVAARPDGA
jgi:hypothetical protein